MANRLIAILATIMLAGCITPIEISELPELPGTLPGGPLSKPDAPGPEAPLHDAAPPDDPEQDAVRSPGPSPEEMTIGEQTGSRFQLSDIESGIFESVNAERRSEGLPLLEWNEELLPAARSHSLSLAKRNLPLTEPGLFCKRPFIHHEGFETGLYAIDRLYYTGIYYFAAVGENLFIAPTSDESLTYDQPEECPIDGDSVAVDGTQAALDGYRERLDFVEAAERVSWESTEWRTREEVEGLIVEGWMESPGHRANLLDPEFDETAIGVAQVNDYLVVTQLFIDRVHCGYKDAECCVDGRSVYCYGYLVCTDYICKQSQ